MKQGKVGTLLIKQEGSILLEFLYTLPFRSSLHRQGSYKVKNKETDSFKNGRQASLVTFFSREQGKREQV